MLPNTFINFISFVKSSEGITMMRKEYKTKSNYEQMRNDYFCFILWNRLNIFEILNHIIINRSRLYIRIKTGYQYLNKSEKFRLNDFRITNFSHSKYFISFSRSFPYQICHLNYSNKTMFLSIQMIDFVGHEVHPYYRQEESDIKLICYFWIHEEIKMKQVIP